MVLIDVSTTLARGLNELLRQKLIRLDKFCRQEIVIVICLPTEHLRSSWELFETCPCVPDRIGIWKCWFLRRGENRSTRRKTSRSKGENQQQTQPTYGVDARIRTRATLVGGECSHHCATLAQCLRYANNSTLIQMSCPTCAEFKTNDHKLSLLLKKYCLRSFLNLKDH